MPIIDERIPLWWLMQGMSVAAWYLDRWSTKLNMWLLKKLK